MAYSLTDFDPVDCVVCGKPLTPKQIAFAKENGREPRYCSYDCSQVDSRFDSIQEPMGTKRDVESFYKTISKRLEELNCEERAMIRSQTPEDDSPEAEKRLRQQLCPNGYTFASTGTDKGL